MLPYPTPFFHLRLRVTSAATQHIDLDQPGILCFGFPALDGNPALIVIWDEDCNDGASVTNCVETVLRYLAHEWREQMDASEALVVERDSNGDFDHAMPDWSGKSVSPGAKPRIPAVSWQPLMWPPTQPRSRAAFLAMFGARGRLVLDAIDLGSLCAAPG